MNTGSILWQPSTAHFYLYTAPHCEGYLSNQHPQPEPPHSRRRAAEIVLVGVCIGIAIVAIRMLTAQGSQIQWMAMVVAALVLALLHLAIRQSIRHVPPPPVTPRLPRRPTRVQQSELFANEIDQRWTGLAETPPTAERAADPRRNP